MDSSAALFKCCDYDHDPKAMADKIPQFIKDNPFIAHVHTSATEKALDIFGRRYATGVAKSIQSIAMYMLDDGEFFLRVISALDRSLRSICYLAGVT
ncbi:hypothetical protein ABBQ32_004925 [Trebouxia sp. C0010 RCD-2024]